VISLPVRCIPVAIASRSDTPGCRASLILATLAFALSTDYGVFLLARIRKSVSSIPPWLV
jgi:uncharacterized membrane protein YdfJ with MMPL/SSD domain